MIKYLGKFMLICILVAGCKRPDTEGHARAESKHILHSICILVEGIESVFNDHPPTELSALVDYLEKHGYEDMPYNIDYEHKTISDAWGHTLIVMSEAGQFIGLGSPGTDGLWQEGKGDDIIVTLEEVR